MKEVAVEDLNEGLPQGSGKEVHAKLMESYFGPRPEVL